MRPDEYARHDGLGLADLVNRGEVSAAELLEAALARAEQVNPKLNALVRIYAEDARQAAKNFVPKGEKFAGVPLVLKDIFGDCAGMSTRFGCAFFPDQPAVADSALVARFKAAGLIPFAKSNVPEYGLPPFTEPTLYGPARNPWNLDRTTGGSSGGSGAAVAAGIVPIAHANDAGGSIRIPAAACGLVGLKPSRGRTSAAPYGDPTDGLYNDGVVTRTVRDTAAALDAISGNEPGDPRTAPPPPFSYFDAARTDPPRLKIAFSCAHPFGETPHAEARRAVENAAKLCAGLGHHVEEAVPEIDPNQVAPAFLAVYAANLAVGIAAVEHAVGRPPRQEELEPMTWNFLALGRTVTASHYLGSMAVLQAIGRGFARFFTRYDVLLTPALGEPPFPIGTFDPRASNATMTDPRIAGFAHTNPLYNLSGQPAISLPLHQSEDGLPMGVLFGAGYNREHVLLQLAGELERAQPWTGRVPPL